MSLHPLAQLGQVAAAQMAREGQLISRHPLLVQKALVDKLSDKVQVIVAPPGMPGQLFAHLSGSTPGAPTDQPADPVAPAADEE